MCNQSPKWSEIAPITAPSNFNGAAPPRKKMYSNFHTCVAAHDVDKFGEVISTNHKVIRPNGHNFALIFEFQFSIFFAGHPNFWTSLIKRHQFPNIWQSVTAIGREGSEILPVNQMPPKLFWRKPPILRPTMSN